MAEKLLDLCLDAEATGVVVILNPNDEVEEAPEPPYYFRVYYSQEEAVVSEGESVTLENVGRIRVLAWEKEPDPIPEINFNAPTWISPNILVSLEGEVSIGSPGDDPWPPT